MKGNQRQAVGTRAAQDVCLQLAGRWSGTLAAPAEPAGGGFQSGSGAMNGSGSGMNSGGFQSGGMGGQFWPTPEMAVDHKIVYPEYLDADTPEKLWKALTSTTRTTIK